MNSIIRINCNCRFRVHACREVLHELRKAALDLENIHGKVVYYCGCMDLILEHGDHSGIANQFETLHFTFFVNATNFHNESFSYLILKLLKRVSFCLIST